MNNEQWKDRWQPERPEKRRNGKKWTTGIAMALTFGLIAGLSTYGVYRVADRIHPVGASAAAEPGETGNSGEKILSGSSGSDVSDGQVSSGTKADSAAVPEERVSSGSSSADASASAESNSSSSASGTDTESPAASGSGTQTARVPGDHSVITVTENCMPALVTISTMSVQQMRDFFGGTQEYQVQGAGTGVIIGENSEELLIATNNHVVEGAQQLSVGFVDESAISGSIKGTDAESDLAVVSVKFSEIPENTLSRIRIASVGDSDALQLGEKVVAIGNALGYGQSVTAGYVSGLDRTLTFQDGNGTFVSDGLIQTDAAINSGNSGGALLNMNGELVGINEAKSSGSSSGASVDNVGYAIPMSRAEPILEELMNAKTREAVSEEKQGYLGVTCADVTDDYAQIYGMPKGVCFTDVVAGGPADEAGAEKGDILVRFDGRHVTDYDTLKRIMQYYRAGETVEITVARAADGSYKEQNLSLTLGEKSAVEKLQRAGSPKELKPTPDVRNNIFGRLFGGN